MAIADSVAFGADGLLPAIVQDVETGEVLMLAYMNREALQRTLETGKSHFWSRSRQTLWRKGETSGNVQTVEEIRLDCDGDTLLLKVDQTGPACHTGARSCFYRRVQGDGLAEVSTDGVPENARQTTILQKLHDVIADRKHNPKEGSYTCHLFSAGQEKILKKVMEEASEVLIASMEDDNDQVIYEVADLLYHLLVLLGFHDIPLSAVFGELEKRRRSAA